MELTSNEAVKQAIMAGLGSSIMPLIGIQKEIQNKDLQIVPIKGLPIMTNWSLIWLKGKNHSPAALAYLAYLKEEKDQIINTHFSWYESI
jgi:DNA-binding transcriptional LysR family regulator